MSTNIDVPRFEGGGWQDCEVGEVLLPMTSSISR